MSEWGEIGGSEQWLYIHLQSDAEAAMATRSREMYARSVEIYRKSLKDIRSEIGDLYSKYADASGKLSYDVVTQYNRLHNLENRIVKRLREAGSNERRVLSRGIEDVYEEAFYRNAYALESSLDAKLGFGTLTEDQVKAALYNPYDRIQWPDRHKEAVNVAIRQIEEEISTGIIQGKGYVDVSKAVGKRVGMQARRSQRIIQTEMHRARSAGQALSLDKAAAKDIPVHKVWMATLDERTRASHGQLDGRRVSRDVDDMPDEFEIRGASAEYPGGFGVAEEDINCRCILRGGFHHYDGKPIEEWEPDERWDPTQNKQIKYKNYEQWHQERILKEAPDVDLPAAGDATSVAEVKELIEREWGIEADFPQDMPLDMANEMVVEMKKVEQIAPEALDWAETFSVAPTHRDYIGVCRWGRHVSFNTEYFTDFSHLKATVDHAVKTNFSVQGKSYYGTVAHEFGHVLHHGLTEKLGLVDPRSRARIKTGIHQKWRRDAMKSVGKTVKNHHVAEEVSRYATKDEAEFFAEAFSEYVDSPNPRPVAQYIGEVVEETLAEHR